MANPAAIAEIDARISVVRENLRELVEQASAFSKTASEEAAADRIAQQEAQLEALLKEREAAER